MRHGEREREREGGRERHGERETERERDMDRERERQVLVETLRGDMAGAALFYRRAVEADGGYVPAVRQPLQERVHTERVYIFKKDIGHIGYIYI